MIQKICEKLVQRAVRKMPEIDEQRAEVIKYGFELMIGEFPKIILMFVIAILLGKIKYFLISVAIICPYKICSGGVHLKTHIGCILMTCFVYLGNVYISEFIKFDNLHIKYVVTALVYLFSIYMILLNAPADTDDVPILRKKERANKKVESIIVVSIIIAVSIFSKDKTVSNMCIVGTFLQTITITKSIYKIFGAKFGYFEYIKENK